MRWRTLLTVLLGFALPLPLAWLLHSTLLSGYGTDQPPARLGNLVPMLTPEERQRLSTYEQTCQTDTNCEPPLRCFFNMRTATQYCTDSTCMRDEHCPKGFACRTLDVDGTDLLRVCSLVGVRKEGESCTVLPSIREEGCEKDLFCEGRCGRSCQMNEPSSCPEGFFCQPGLDGPSCLPTCEGRSCPEGQRCVRMDGRVSVCATVYGQDCEQTPCPQGQDCMFHTYPWHPGRVWMECLRDCGGPDALPCPEGTVCHLYQCHKSCTPEDPSICGPGFACARRSTREPWTCVPGSRQEAAH